MQARAHGDVGRQLSCGGARARWSEVAVRATMWSLRAAIGTIAMAMREMEKVTLAGGVPGA